MRKKHYFIKNIINTMCISILCSLLLVACSSSTNNITDIPKTDPEVTSTEKTSNQETSCTTTIETTATETTTTISKGIDVSKWQSQNKTPIDWKSVKNSGISFVIIRAGYRSASTSELCTDPFFKKHIEGALAAGLEVGVYFHSQAITEVEALEEVDYLMSIIEGYNITYPVCCDYEPTLNARDEIINLTKTQTTDIVKAFLSNVKKHGYDAMLYSDHSDINNYFYPEQLSDYKFWIGYYDKNYENTGIQYKEGNPLPQESYTYHMWQYSCTGKVPGIQGNVDLNVALFQPN